MLDILASSASRGAGYGLPVALEPDLPRDSVSATQVLDQRVDGDLALVIGACWTRQSRVLRGEGFNERSEFGVHTTIMSTETG